ncbi:MAG TPA: putative Ig domain-containing protein, partial [Acidimicrobiales bacterium]|nr:putative Ig domain-containing protein [Acidimicrobiales bacterium]
FDGNTAVVGSAVLGYTPNGTNDATLRRSTISANGGLGPVTSSLGGRLSLVETTYYDNPSGLLLNGGSATNLSGSIVHVAIGAGCAVSGGATVASGGYNLARTGDATCGFSGATDDVFGDPQLGPLALNGGTTRNHLPLASSPALDQVPANFATGVNEAVSGNQVVLCDVGDTDQRGTTLPQGTLCDIGSVEAGQVAPDLTGPTVGSFTVGSPGELAGFSATGSPTPTLSAVGLPAGLTLVSTGPGTAKISGTPAAGTGGTKNVTVTATNEAGSDQLAVTLTVNEAPTVAGPTTVTLIETIDGDAASYTSTGFPVPTLSLTGSLPAGVTFTPGPNGTGTIDGAPAPGTAGTYNVTVVATNGTLPNGSLAVTINVVPRLTITTTALPNGQHSVPYDANVTAIGGTPSYTFSLDSGSLPDGLTLDADGKISGTPSGLPGTATFTVEATDSSNPVQSDTQELSITIERGPTVLTVSPVLIQLGPLGIRFGVVDATLRGGLPLEPIAGQQVTFKAGSATLCTATTNASGFAGCSVGPLGVVQLILAGGVTATYAGNTFWLPATGSGPLIG